MSSNEPARGRSPALMILIVLVLVQIALTVESRLGMLRTGDHDEQLASLRATVDELLGEVTRLRIEQRAEGQGAAALIEKLHVYAPMASDARVTEADYQNSRKEIKAIMRAFESIGEDAWKPVLDEIDKLDPKNDYEVIKRLLEAAVLIDLRPAKQILQEVILGQRLPNARLRWHASRLMTGIDKPLAQTLLRRVLLTESSRGIDVDRAQKYGMSLPDPAAYATTGFHNFVKRYLETEDPKTEDTLLMLMTRVEHDVVTIQECIKELGRRKCQRASKHIKKLYANPPHNQANPMFLNHCLDAVAKIEGKASRAWLEQQLATAPTDIVAGKIKGLLDDL